MENKYGFGGGWAGREEEDMEQRIQLKTNQRKCIPNESIQSNQ